MPPPAQGQYFSYANTSASSCLINANEEWTQISDPAQRRRLQNRLAQRKYRNRIKRRLEELERKAPASEEVQKEEQNVSMNNAKEPFANSSSSSFSIQQQSRGRQASQSPTSPKPVSQEEYTTHIERYGEPFSTLNSAGLSLSYPPPMPGHVTFLTSDGYVKVYDNKRLNPTSSNIQCSIPIATNPILQPSITQSGDITYTDTDTTDLTSNLHHEFMPDSVNSSQLKA
ncbi:unnamed protein product [Clonostachys chloroleuca]|uniref:BZIP domain-containing protein n=1 Tax=Clonostachys chloroleuca TaxID=1926264 RepID=A0AA35PVU3_9HYPO|nr:unnamed protein product [Clonostachys chloroleuca]